MCSSDLRHHPSVAHTEELSEARTDVAEAWHHVKALDRSKDSSRHCQSMADHLVVVVAAGAEPLPVLDKSTAKPLKTRTRLPMAQTLAVTCEVALLISSRVDEEEATRAGEASPSSTTLIPLKELCPTTQISSRETTRTYHRRQILMVDEVVEDEAVVVAVSVDVEDQGAAHHLLPSRLLFHSTSEL